MVIVLVEHFLNAAGKTYFPSWIKETKALLQHYQGFISLDELKLLNEERSHLLLRFQSLELLRIWSKSDDHNRMIEKIGPYRLQKQQSQIFELQDKTS